MTQEATRDDARFQAWLAATQRVVDAAEPERLTALIEVEQERARLMESLRGRPAVAPSAALASRLQNAEAELQTLARRMCGDLEHSIGELRRVRAAALGYRPVPATGPSLVSSDV